MARTDASPEQLQLQEEIKAVVTNIGKFDDLSKATFEVEQGRKLIEKAAKIGVPAQAYAALQRYLTDYDTRTKA